MNNFKHIIEGNWEEVKGKIKNKWGKLTDNDIDKIDGSYKELTGRLQKLYGYKMAEIESELTDFFESSDFEKLKNKAKNKMEEIKSVVLSTLDEYFQSAKKTTANTEKTIVEYAKEHPFKLIGFAAAAGLMMGCLCKIRRN